MKTYRPSSLEVFLDCDLVAQAPALRVGFLHEDRGHIRFEYDEPWLNHKAAFQLDPALTLGRGAFHPDPALGNFGAFLDSSPDRWGQTLMRRRETIEAREQGRKARQLYAWDFLIGVQDATRQGALRFKEPGTQTFLDAHPLPAPPLTSLRELESIAIELSEKNIDDLDKLRRWLSVLVAPGASLGGARPKANFAMQNGDLWIAKFPAREDNRDVGAWEAVLHALAPQCGIDVPEGKLFKFTSSFQTFVTKRFDRSGSRRLHYCSAMTMLGKRDGDEASYLEIAEFLMRHGDRGHVDADLAQLFKRVVFNVIVGHRDDHLRNHGFLMGAQGWRLAPAFDVNPIIDKADHVLAINENSHVPDIGTVLATHEHYRLGEADARAIVEDAFKAVAQWPQVAKLFSISRADIELTGTAFAEAPKRDFAMPRPPGKPAKF